MPRAFPDENRSIEWITICIKLSLGTRESQHSDISHKIFGIGIMLDILEYPLVSTAYGLTNTSSGTRRLDQGIAEMACRVAEIIDF